MHCDNQETGGFSAGEIVLVKLVDKSHGTSSGIGEGLVLKMSVGELLGFSGGN